MKRKIVLDANLLVLWIAGSANRKFIGSHRRLKQFELRHFDLLDQILGEYDGIVVTPHTLAEFWNLVGECRGKPDQDTASIQHIAIRFINAAIEIHRPAKDLTREPALRWLGLSDIAQILVATEEGYDLISADGPLCRHAMERGITTRHFWQIAEGE